MPEAKADAAVCKSGWLRKNHKGGTFAKKNELRYFDSNAFHVRYYTTDAKTKECGKFDLRNVQLLKPASDPNVKSGVSFQIKGRTGLLTISFVEPAEADSWVRLWCSGVSATNLDPSLRPTRDEQLALKFNQKAGSAPLKGSVFDDGKLVSPRSVPSTEEMAKASSLISAQSMQSTPSGITAPPPEAPPTETAAAAATVAGAVAATGAVAAAAASVPAATPEEPAPAEAPGALETDSENLLVVTVPDNVGPGDMLRVTAPTGAKLLITVPEGAVPGNQLEFSVPPKTEDTAEPTKADLEATPATATKASAIDDDAAAIRLQSAVRGHKVRYEMNEQRRLEWLAHYQQPYVAKFDEALALCITPEEEQEVERARQAFLVAQTRKQKAVKAPAAPSCFAKCFGVGRKDSETVAATKLQSMIRGKNARAQREEATRIEWFNFYLAKRNFAEAKKLAVTPEETAKIEEAVQPPKAEDLAATKVQSILRGKKTREDMQESSRIEWLEYYKTSGELDKALEMTVTEEEESEVRTLMSVANPPEDLLKAATKLQSAARGHLARTETQEAARTEWLRFYIESGEFEKAKELAVTQEEEDNVNHLIISQLSVEASEKHKTQKKSCCACLPQVRKPTEIERQAAFVHALEERDWEAATMLAANEQEHDAIAGHKARAATIKQLGLTGNEAEALQLAGSEEERKALEAEGPAELARRDWLEFHIKSGNVEEALKLVVTQEEEDRVLALQDATKVPADEASRRTAFVAAIKAYDWATAEKLATTAEEQQDLKDSAERVKWMQHHMEKGEKEKALSYAITTKEREKIMSGATTV